MEKLMKIIIIFFIIIILLIAVVLYILKKDNNIDENNENEYINGLDFEITESNNVEEVSSTGVVFNIKKCIQYYIDYINDNNYEAVIKVLDQNYIKSNNLTEANVKNVSSKFIKSSYFINKTYEKDVTVDQIIYLVYGKLVNSETYKKIEDVNFTVIVDNDSQAFSIIPEVIEDNKFNYNLNIKYDNDNYYNEYTFKDFSDAEIVDEYFMYYKNLLLKQPEEAYNLLDDEYKKIRFNNSLDMYKEYLASIDLDKVYPENYLLNYKNNCKEYVVMDKNGFYYIIDELKPMNISLQLDTYSIASEKFKETYDAGGELEKVSLNVDKWLKMIKNKDYYNAYNNLDETFRNTNFGNLDSFKKYIEANYGEGFEYKLETNSKINNIYTQVVKISNNGEESEINFVIKLLEDRNFILSFQI